jgi:hypothetical protein
MESQTQTNFCNHNRLSWTCLFFYSKFLLHRHSITIPYCISRSIHYRSVCFISLRWSFAIILENTWWFHLFERWTTYPRCIHSISCLTFCNISYIGSQSFQYHIASGQLDSKGEVVTFAIIVVDIFMIFGLGLLVGLNRRLLKRFRLISQGKEIIEEKK